MAKKINPKSKNYVDKLADNLDGVGFSGPKELDSAVDELAKEPTKLLKKFSTKIRRLLGLPIKYEEESK